MTCSELGVVPDVYEIHVDVLELVEESPSGQKTCDPFLNFIIPEKAQERKVSPRKRLVIGSHR